MEWLIICMLILIGLILVIMEFLVFPGINVAGLVGFFCIVAGVYCGYYFYSTTTGHFVLLGTMLLSGGVTWYVLRSDTWKKMSLHTSIDSVVEGVDESVKEGDTGVCLGRLAPMGNVKIGEAVVEAESQSGYIDANREIVVIKVLKNKVIVKQVV